MKLSCNVARDLLPLYHDGVCSDESRALVEEHLDGCPDCAGVLKELRGEIEVPHEAPDDGAVLKKLEKQVGSGKKRAWIRGAAAVLAAVVLVLAGRYGWWYVNDHCYYQKLAGTHEPLDGDAGANSYRWSEGRYDFSVTVPQYPGDHGMASVTSGLRDMPKNIVPGREVEASLYLGRGDYFYQLALSVTVRTQAAGQAHLQSETFQEFLALDREGNPIHAGIFDQQTHDRQAQVLEDYHWEIRNIIEAAQAAWPFLTEE